MAGNGIAGDLSDGNGNANKRDGKAKVGDDAAKVGDDAIKLTEVGTISCRLRREPGAIIELARGTQLQVAYGDKRVDNVKLAEAFGGLQGGVKSGSEWVYVRNDGVILVDARVTIAFSTSVLMDVTLKGTIDLTKTFKAPDGEKARDGEDAYRIYLAGKDEPTQKDAKGPFHKLIGSVRFEGGAGPVDRVDEDYVDHFTDSATNFKNDQKLRLLVRQQFIVDGKVYIMKTPHYDPTETELRVLSW